MPPSTSHALADRLAGAETSVAAEPVRRASRTEPRVDRSRWWLWAAVAIAVLALAFASGAAYVAYTNEARADDWEQRAFQLERNTEQLNGVLAERSTQLNERTRELNKLATTVTRQQNALTRSESDVESLSRRQRELAAEKARVEDSRAALTLQSSALEGVADALVVCNAGLFQLFGFVVNGDQGSADAIVSDVSADCEQAESALGEYRALYG